MSQKGKINARFFINAVMDYMKNIVFFYRHSSESKNPWYNHNNSLTYKTKAEIMITQAPDIQTWRHNYK